MPAASGLELDPSNPDAELSGGGRGLIAVTDADGLSLLTPSGRSVNRIGAGFVVTQPTWSRDGAKLAATLSNADGGVSRVAVLDVASGQVSDFEARRPYFFYSWSHDGTRLAALGPAAGGGTAMDVLDATGAPTSPDTVTDSSVFIAWAPDGRRLLVHAGPRLQLFDDPDQLGDYTDLGTVGSGFQAASWVPDSNAFLYVADVADEAGDGIDSDGIGSDGSSADGDGPATPRLLRRSLADGVVTDLGDATGLTAMTVHPDGDRVALAFVQSAQRTQPTQPTVPLLPVSAGGRFAAAAAAQPTAAQATFQRRSEDRLEAVLGATRPTAAQASLRGAVEILDLATGERTEALDGPGLWVAWSPDGQSLLMATTASADASALLAWHVWDGSRSLELVQFTPSANFLRNYLPFADQYDETPRLWSPDSDAITYSATRAGSGDFAAVSRLDSVGDTDDLGPGTVSFWSPLP